VLPVVTTTWAEWKRAHPETTVLSLDTGYKRDYSEGAAYRQYFATDALIFQRHDRDVVFSASASSGCGAGHRPAAALRISRRSPPEVHLAQSIGAGAPDGKSE
jgi:hypothetical protein